MFQDITTLLLDPKAFKDTIDLFVERYKGKNISVVAGIEARGFIFGTPIALAIGAKFVPLRKPRKLPGDVIFEEYTLEYGRDRLEMHVGAVKPGEHALVVDDLIATGGTLCAAMNLLERVGAEVVECACVIELPDLQGRERLHGKPLDQYLNVLGASVKNRINNHHDSAQIVPLDRRRHRQRKMKFLKKGLNPQRQSSRSEAQAALQKASR
uniref:adenine phosphoribosyltransferase n=1 Tax=Cannabis sativa TaxID=3483 RepID=A0A803PM36_CANSA